jgi:F-type H+-transporting ATPase subunit delta
MDSTKHDTVLDAGSIKARLAKVYAEGLFAAALKTQSTEAIGEELAAFISTVYDSAPQIESFLASPVVGKKAKSTALDAALPGHASDLMRGLFTVLARNGRLDLLRGISVAYRQLLEKQAGRIPVRVTSAMALSESQQAALTKTLTSILKQQPVIAVHVDPDVLGGLVVQIGDRVIDTSVRTRLQTLRKLLLETP